MIITVTYTRNARGGLEPGVVSYEGYDWEIENGLLWLKNDKHAICIPLINVRGVLIKNG